MASDLDVEETRRMKILSVFERCRGTLDKKNDLREKIIKKSRDVTIESKRIIFHLHRSATVDLEKKEKILAEAKERLRSVYNIITYGIGGLLATETIWQYEQAYSAGMQEFVEAASFYYYLFSKRMLQMDDLHSGEFLFKEDADKESEERKEEDIPKRNMIDLLTKEDFLLGIADLTGELMRKCVSSGSLEEPFELRDVLKVITEAFYVLGDDYDRKLVRKYYTLKASLRKVDRVCYMIKVRGLEREKLMADKGITSVNDLFESLTANNDAQEDYE